MEILSRVQIKKSLEQSLGDVLKRERLRKKMELAEVSFKTRIPIYVLARIEQGKFAYIWECYKLAAFYGKKLKLELI